MIIAAAGLTSFLHSSWRRHRVELSDEVPVLKLMCQISDFAYVFNDLDEISTFSRVQSSKITILIYIIDTIYY